MQCSQCGAEAASASQAFCHTCGAPMGGGLEPTPPAAPTQAAPAGGARRVGHDFTGGALPLFGWLLLLGVSLVLIVPAPFALVAYMRWVLGKVRLSDGSNYRFLGTAGSVWVLTTLYGIVQLINLWGSIRAEQEPVYNWVQVGVVPVNLVLGWFLLRWSLGFTEALGRRLAFEGSVWGLIGWSLLIYVSFLTIIGWAWAFAGYMNWLAQKTRGPGLRYEFTGTGGQILWRTVVYVLGIIPIVTIPWSLKWYFRWMVQQFVVVDAQARDL